MKKRSASSLIGKSAAAPSSQQPERRGLGTTLIDSGFPSATGRALLYARRRPLPHRGRHKANDHTAYAAAALTTHQSSSIQIQRAARRRVFRLWRVDDLPPPEVLCACISPA